MPQKLKMSLIALALLVLGILIGGYLFIGVQPRSFLALNACQDRCLNSSELIALFSSVGIQRLGGNLPAVIRETDKTIVINDPNKLPTEKFHFVLIPKKDIRDAADISAADEPYLADIFGVIKELVDDNNLVKYKVVTNGPGYQSVSYLHFHLIAQ